MSSLDARMVVDSPISYSPEPGRSYASIEVPRDGTVWVDNTLSLRNNSIRADGAAGNAAIRLQNSAGVETCALGFSYDSALESAGFYHDALYAEIGSAFGATPVNFIVVVSMKPGMPGYPIGASWIPFEIESLTGNVKFRSGPNGGSVMIGLEAPAPGSDGKLSVTSESVPAFTARQTGAQYASILWNDLTSGNNLFQAFGTEGSYTQRGDITYNRPFGVVNYGTTCDDRSKTVIGPVEDAVNRVMQLRPCRGKMHGADSEIDFFVAHELQKVVPSAVVGEKDGLNADGTPKMQTVDKSSVIPLLTAALQEALSSIAHLQEEVADIRSINGPSS